MSCNDLLGGVGLKLVVDHHDDNTTGIETTTSSTTGHLNVLGRGKRTSFNAIPLGNLGENDSLGRHVETDREGLSREENLDQRLLEENLNSLLENRQQTRMMDTDTTLQQGKQVDNLREVSVLLRQTLNSIAKDMANHGLFRIVVEAESRDVHGHILTLSLAEVENDNRVELLLDGHSNNLGNIRAIVSATLVGLLILALSFLSSVRVVGISSLLLLDLLHNLVEILLVKVALFVDDKSGATTTGREEVVLKRSWSEIGVYDVTGLVVDLGNPFGELESVGNGGRKEDVSDLVGKHNDGLLPDDTSRLVSHVVNLVEDNPSNFSHNL